MHGLDLSRANLENLNLVKANLQQALFDGENLQSAQLHYAQLQDAVLDIIADGRDMWTVEEWLAVTSKIEASDLTVGEYINQFNKRKTK